MVTKDDVIKNQEKEILRLREKLEYMSLEKCVFTCCLTKINLKDFSNLLKTNLKAQGKTKFSLAKIEEVIDSTLIDWTSEEKRTDTK